MLSAQMLSGIPEVDLGIEAKIQEKIAKTIYCKLMFFLHFFFFTKNVQYANYNYM